MKRPSLIVINGRPGSGKTTLAERLSKDLSIPYFSKDEFKELIFDTLGYSDQEWSIKCNIPSYALIILLAKKCLFAGRDIMIESNFNPKFDLEKINKIVDESGARVIQVLCSADKDVLFSRFKERALSGKRHPGHNDGADFSKIKEKHFTADFGPLDLDGKNIVYDTTEFKDEDYLKVAKTIKSFIENDGAEEEITEE